MLKMYNAEVLSKFPVVQHFPFGSLFKWERDPRAAPSAAFARDSHQASMPRPNMASAGASMPAPGGGSAMIPTKAPWAK